MITCILCRGLGYTPWGPCLDCKELGRVKHCVACGGKGKLWLGGSDYLDCPACPSSRGAARTEKKYVFLGNHRFELADRRIK